MKKREQESFDPIEKISKTNCLPLDSNLCNLVGVILYRILYRKLRNSWKHWATLPRQRKSNIFSVYLLFLPLWFIGIAQCNFDTAGSRI